MTFVGFWRYVIRLAMLWIGIQNVVWAINPHIRGWAYFDVAVATYCVDRYIDWRRSDRDR